jgi:hypothetical protein
MRSIPKAVAGVLAVFAMVGPAPAFAAGEPTAKVSSTILAAGQTVNVYGAGWAPRSLVRMELCGNSAADATTDCDVRNSTDSGVRDDGSVAGTLVVATPPVACPCVVRLSTVDGTVALVPVQLGGILAAAPTGKVDTPSLSRLVDMRIAVVDRGSWTKWFGARSDRVVDITLENTGRVPIDDPILDLRFGRGHNPSGVIATPDLARLEPGATHKVTVPFALEALSFGDYTVWARLGGYGTPRVVRAQTSTYPWGLVILLVVLLQLLLIAVRNRVRRRVAPADSAETSFAPHDDGAPEMDTAGGDEAVVRPEQSPSPSTSAPLLADASPAHDQLTLEIVRERERLAFEIQRLHDVCADLAEVVAARGPALLRTSRGDDDDPLAAVESSRQHVSDVVQRFERSVDDSLATVEARVTAVLRRVDAFDEALGALADRGAASAVHRDSEVVVDISGRRTADAADRGIPSP